MSIVLLVENLISIRVDNNVIRWVETRNSSDKGDMDGAGLRHTKATVGVVKPQCMASQRTNGQCLAREKCNGIQCSATTQVRP